jgi:hypothetical protein
VFVSGAIILVSLIVFYSPESPVALQPYLISIALCMGLGRVCAELLGNGKQKAT